MKKKVLFLFILTFFVILQVIQAAGTTTPAATTTPSTTPATSSSGASVFADSELSLFEQYLKPSKAFTAVILVYFGLIVIGAILVLVLVKPLIDN